MPRSSRLYAPGRLSHLMTRGKNGYAVFLEPAD